MTVRSASLGDLADIQRIYAHHVVCGLGTFEEIAPDLAEMTRRFNDVTGQGFPYLVAERQGRVVGYAYISLYRTRSAYRYAVEDSIYVAPDAIGKGIGRALLTALIRLSEAHDYRQMVAVIGDSGNAASIELHRSLGFRMVAVLEQIAYKRQTWVDAVIMQRRLGPGGTVPPGAA